MYNEMCPPNSIQHVVRRGDTFWRLSQAYGVNMQTIIDANPGANANNLQIGMTLCIPTAQTGSCPEGSLTYMIQAGDTFWKLSQAYGISLQSIIDANPGVNANNLQIGSTLCIPAAMAQPFPMNKMEAQVSPAATVQPAPTNKMEAQVSPAATVQPAPMNKMEAQVSPAATVQPAPMNKMEAQVSPAATVQPAPMNKMEAQVSPTATVQPAPTNKMEAQVSPAATVQPAPMNKMEAQVSPAATVQPISCPEGSFPYTIQEGDTFWKLSQTYGVSVQSIIDANPGVNAIGATICIPIAPVPQVSPAATAQPVPTNKLESKVSLIMTNQPVSCPEGSIPYMIQAGDTLWMLSQAYGVSVQSILDANPGVNAKNLQIGSTLCIPTAPIPQVSPAATAQPVPTNKLESKVSPIMTNQPVSCPEGSVPYTIKAGDTLWLLSQAYGVSVQSILDANPGVNAKNLLVGSTLCIPAAPAPQVSPIQSTPSKAMTLPASLTPSCPSDFAYLIEKCDSICGIARKFYVSVDSILQRNPGINPRCLQAGTYIYIPMNCCGRDMCRYAVRAGDTLNRIANRFNVCPSAIISANPNIDFNCLAMCQIICIPNA